MEAEKQTTSADRALRRVAGSTRRDFESLSIEVRHGLLLAVDQLIEDWPRHFVSVALAAGWRSHHFSAIETSVPYWLSSVVREHLDRKPYVVSAGEVSHATAALKRSRQAVSKVSVKRLLGVTEGKHLDQLMPPRQSALSSSEMQRLVELLDGALRTAPVARDERASLVRDAACIAVAAWTRMNFLSVCRLSIADGQVVLGQWRQAKAHAQAANYDTWMTEYLGSVRPRFERFGDRRSELFLTRFGVPYRGFGLAPRFAGLLRSAGIADWSRGVNLLIHRPHQTKLAER
jgi:hypothetical protein